MEVANSSVPDTNSVSPANSHTPPSRGSHRRGLIAACFLFVGCVFGLAQAARAQQPAPLVVDADQVIYDPVTQMVEAIGNVRLSYRGIRLSADHAAFDLRRELLVARGRVVLIDARGRELRGETLTYDVRLDLADMTRAETIIDRAYVRSDRVQMRAQQIIAREATVTTCDPARPAYRVTASQLEIVPGDRIVARRATLWLGRFRVFTVPVYVISLRTPEETAGSFPRVGYNNVDGLWVDYRYFYPLGSVQGTLFAKYGTMSGFIAHNTLTHQRPGYSFTFTVGRIQDSEMRLFDQAELVLTRPWRPAGTLPVLAYASLSSGWFRELTSGAQTTRQQYLIGIDTQAVRLGTRASARALVTWQEAFYGTGARQGVLRVSASTGYLLAPGTALSLTYDRVGVTGATPFLFDAIAVTDRINEVGLQLSASGTGRSGISWEATLGSVYSFRDQAVYLTGVFGQAGADFHWRLGARYGLTATYLRLTADIGLAIGRGTDFTIQAIYDAHVREFRDLDFIITSRLCDCIDVALKYRQVRQEIWFEIGLSAFPQSRLQFQFPRP